MWKKKTKGIFKYVTIKTTLGALRRLSCLLPLFEDSGNMSLILCENGFPISSPDLKAVFQLPLELFVYPLLSIYLRLAGA